LEDGPQLTSARDAEIEGGADALGRQRQAVAGRVTDEEHAVFRGLAQSVRNPVALVADALGTEVGGEQLGRVAHVEPRVEGADADPQLAAGGEAPAVSGR